jgi:hypothetical protein
VRTIQEAVEADVHEHSRATVTATLPVPPDGANEAGCAVSAGWHRTGVGAVPVIVSAVLPHAEIKAALVSSARNG